MNQETSLEDLAPSTLVDGAPSDISKEDEPDFIRQGSSSFNSLPMQENQSPKGGDHQTPEFDGNIDLSFLGDEQGNVIGGTSDSSVAAANVPDLQRLDFEPSSFSTPLMGVSASSFPAMSNTVQSASSTFDPLHEDSTNEEQTRSSLVNPASPIPAQVYFPL
ncbi:hypothetical protein OIU77_019585 [Salix suchowensis]|uniref:Uncharacterized protein n=1 Tax=Salix suchowensis TaxID=1278906 RepID=A0ABQ9CGK4_9ROSI|nr:hypothetical protein OIU77_019585 [Salix suchowensis]